MNYQKFLPLFLITFIFGACAQINSTSPEPETTILSRESTPTSPTSNDRYFNEEGSFSLSLPPDWQVVGPLDASAGQGVAFNLYRLGSGPIGSGGPGLSSIILADSATLTLEDFIIGQCSTCSLAPVAETSLGNVPARQTVIGGSEMPFDVTWTFFEHNGKLVGLAIHDPETLEPLDEVLKSLELH